MSLPPFQKLLDQYAEPIYRFIVASIGRDEADDCFQETFLAALKAYPRLRNPANLRAWLFTIAHRKTIDAVRRRDRKLPPRQAPQHVEHRDTSVWTLVRQLPAKQRAAVFHRYAGGLSYREVGAAIGCSEEAARRNVHEGLKKLREVWEE